MRLATVLMLACLTPASAVWGQDFRSGSRVRTVSGVVLDSVTGVPVVGADVTLRRPFRTVLTDGRGRFNIAGAEDGPDELTVRRMGYVARTIRIEVGERLALQDILLSPAPVALSELEVAARRGGVVMGGMVVDSLAGSPVARVQVRLEKSRVATLTDAAGRFSALVQPGEIITVDGLGYVARTVTLPAELDGDFLQIRVLPDPVVLPRLKTVAGEFSRIELLTAGAVEWNEANLLKYSNWSLTSFIEWRSHCAGRVFLDNLPAGWKDLMAVPMYEVYEVICGSDRLSMKGHYTAIYTKDYVRQQARRNEPVVNPLKRW